MGASLRSLWCAGLGAVCVLAGARAGLADISRDVFVIRAECSEGVAEYRATSIDGHFAPNGSYQWSLDQPVTLRSASGSVMAVLQGASVLCHEDPDVSISFDVLAGNLEIAFTISSAQVSFPTIMQGAGRTSATLALTDLTNDGAVLNPAAQPGAFTSRFNGAAPGGTTFHDSFLSPVRVVIPGGSQTVSDDFPGGGDYLAMGGPVSNIGVRYEFFLSHGDEASGTGFFRVEPAPAPASLWILAVGGLVRARRRR
jgi:hypothetical protein